jgi:hypothetical protein
MIFNNLGKPEAVRRQNMIIKIGAANKEIRHEFE